MSLYDASVFKFNITLCLAIEFESWMPDAVASATYRYSKGIYLVGRETRDARRDASNWPSRHHFLFPNPSTTFKKN
jgi:hypothetical protein